jgi:nucleoside-diphosphate-sugar epimerase
LKIAITGHTAGIGHAFATILQGRGHEIIGFSKRDGWDIRIIPKIVNKIKDCDLFINNAQQGYAQTDLLYAIWNIWQGDSSKHIWCISTMMTHTPVDPPITDQDSLAINAYRTQKIALEEAVNQLRWKNHFPLMTIIRPGNVATQPGQIAPWPYCDTTAWANLVISTMSSASANNMRFQELSLAPTKYPLTL